MKGIYRAMFEITMRLQSILFRTLNVYEQCVGQQVGASLCMQPVLNSLIGGLHVGAHFLEYVNFAETVN